MAPTLEFDHCTLLLRRVEHALNVSNRSLCIYSVVVVCSRSSCNLQSKRALSAVISHPCLDLQASHTHTTRALLCPKDFM